MEGDGNVKIGRNTVPMSYVPFIGPESWIWYGQIRMIFKKTQPFNAYSLFLKK